MEKSQQNKFQPKGNGGCDRSKGPLQNQKPMNRRSQNQAEINKYG